MRRDGEDWYAVTLAVEQAINQMEIARAAAACANGEGPGKVGLGSGSKCRTFLMPDMNPIDGLVPPKRIRQAVERIPDNAIDALYADLAERLCQKISRCLRHVRYPLSAIARATVRRRKRLLLLAILSRDRWHRRR
jgi:hypothetical protein